MRIKLNGETLEVSGCNLAEVLNEHGYEGAVVATALNGEFVPADVRGETIVNPGDSVEVLAPMQGG